MSKKSRTRARNLDVAQPTQPSIESWMEELWNKYWYPFLLAIIVVVLYATSFNNTLVFDDVRNLGRDIFRDFGSLWPPKLRMLSNGTFVWLRDLFGFKFPMQRFVNVLWHLGVAWLLYRFTLKLITQADGGTAPTEKTVRCVKWAIAFFALNPVAVYAVAYLIQRSILMGTFFSLVTLLCFIRGLQSPKPWGWWVVSVVTYGIAMISKEVVVALPLVLLPLYVFFSRPSAKRLLILIGMIVGSLALATYFVWPILGHKLGQVYDAASLGYASLLETIRPDIRHLIYPLSIVNQMTLFFAYLFYWFIPFTPWMSIDMRTLFPINFFSWPYWAGALGFVLWVGTALWLLLRHRGRWGLVGLCMIVPALLFVTEFAVARPQDPFVLYRSYLWFITLPTLTALALYRLRPLHALIIGWVVATIFGVLSLERLKSLKNETTVWSDASNKVNANAPKNVLGRWRAFINLGVEQMKAGRYDEAMTTLQKAIALDERAGVAAINIALILQRVRAYDQALVQFNLSEEQGFKDFVLYVNRGDTLVALGRYDEAIANYKKGLDLEGIDNNARSILQGKIVTVANILIEKSGGKPPVPQPTTPQPATPQKPSPPVPQAPVVIKPPTARNIKLPESLLPPP